MSASPESSLGVSKQVRRRAREGRWTVRAALASLEVLDEAITRQWGDRRPADHRRWEQEVREATGSQPRSITLPQLVLAIAQEVDHLGADMVDADRALDRARRRRRAAGRQRDAERLELYRRLSRARRDARGAVGRRDAHRWPALAGETVREVHQLLVQTDRMLAWIRDATPPPGSVGLAIDRDALAARLEPLRGKLAARLDEIDHLDAVRTAALARRDAAVERFDDRHLKGARLLETLFRLLGLPTLAAAVRPHLKVSGRVGRPSKHPMRDEHPDLVARFQAAYDLLRAEHRED